MKRRLRRACAACQKAHASCDQDRPCGRCVKLDTIHDCYDTELKKRGRKPGSAASKAKAASINIEEGVFPLDLNDHPDEPHQHHVVYDDTDVDAADHEPPADLDENGHPYPHPKGDTQLMRPTLREATQALTIRPTSTKPINPNDIRALIDQIRELKANQKILREELRALKEDQLRQDSQQNQSLFLGTSPGRRPLLQNASSAAPIPNDNSSSSIVDTNDSTTNSDDITDKAWVIYDLTKLPPTVRTANSTFCKMLGYEMTEVIGQPWKKFVHPDYYERALQILSARRLNNALHSPIEFEQVYVHKNGGVFFTIDSHTIVILEGQPVSDVVSIRLAPRPMVSATAASASATAGSSTTSRRSAGKLQEAQEIPITPNKRNTTQNGRTRNSNSSNRISSSIDNASSRRVQTLPDDSDLAQRKLEDLSLEGPLMRGATGRPTRARSSNVFAANSSSTATSKPVARKYPPRTAKRAAIEVARAPEPETGADTEEEDYTDHEVDIQEIPPAENSHLFSTITPPSLLYIPGGDNGLLGESPSTATGLNHHVPNIYDPSTALPYTGVANSPLPVIPSPTSHPLGSDSTGLLFNTGAPASPSSQLFNFENDLPWLSATDTSEPFTAPAMSNSASLLSSPANTTQLMSNGILPHSLHHPAGLASSLTPSSPIRIGSNNLKESVDDISSLNIDDVLSGFLSDEQNGNTNTTPIMFTPPPPSSDLTSGSSR